MNLIIRYMYAYIKFKLTIQDQRFACLPHDVIHRREGLPFVEKIRLAYWSQSIRRDYCGNRGRAATPVLWRIPASHRFSPQCVAVFFGIRRCANSRRICAWIFYRISGKLRKVQRRTRVVCDDSKTWWPCKFSRTCCKRTSTRYPSHFFVFDFCSGCKAFPGNVPTMDRYCPAVVVYSVITALSPKALKRNDSFVRCQAFASLSVIVSSLTRWARKNIFPWFEN